MKKFLLDLLDWIYKKKCYFCGNSKESLKMCSKCYDKMTFTPINANRIILGVNIYTCGYYKDIMQKLIRGVKYHNQKELAFYQARFMWEYWQKLNLKGDFTVIPVPLSDKRKKKRKYNHMELVADEFCKLSGYAYDFELIKRIKDTKPQYNLKRKDRMENLKNAFKVTKTTDKPILIIDDICTTGSTFESMITELHKKGVYNITCLATATVDF
ncbi:ComF family protein [bacterium]|nr:ComF family protein [bacterium]